MNIEEALLVKLRVLPFDKQQELLDFADFLAQKFLTKKPHENSHGVLEHLNVSISKEEIEETIHEACANFPREQFYEAMESLAEVNLKPLPSNFSREEIYFPAE